MKNEDKKRSEEEDLKRIAKSTEDPQMKRAIEDRLKRKSEDNPVRK